MSTDQCDPRSTGNAGRELARTRRLHARRLHARRLVVASALVIALATAGCTITSVQPLAGPGPENVTFAYDCTPVAVPVRAVITGDCPLAARPGPQFRYLQFTWAPVDGEWYGTTPTQRAPWYQPVTDATDGDGLQHTDGRTWQYLDPSRATFQNWAVAYVESIRARGFDGVFIDVGGRALEGPARKPTSYVALLSRIARVLPIGLNYTASGDPLHSSSGLALPVSWVLHENATADLGLIVRDAAAPNGRIVAMGKSLSAIGSPGKATEMTYQWALAKVSGQPVAINTGTDQCGGIGTVGGNNGCNRMGQPSELTGTRLGAAGHIAFSGTTITRTFANGTVRVDLATRTATVS